ncbi:MAG: hypothetical protein WBU92_04785 [Candidatus Dormiibacterota bacterium]
MLRHLHLRRLYLSVVGLLFFLLALGLSWGAGANHLWVQGVAMVMALAAFGLAALAAR